MPKKKTKTPKLNPDDILVAEFNYIAQSAFQANEDRARVTNFYLVSLGSFLAAIFTAVFGQSAEGIDFYRLAPVFGGLFSVLVAQGIFTLLQLAYLRVAWFSSVEAMNAIKAHYEDSFPHFEEVFLWRSSTLPKRFKPNSAGFILALQVILLTGIAAGGAIWLFRYSDLGLNHPGIYLPIPLTWLLLTLVYKYAVKK